MHMHRSYDPPDPDDPPARLAGWYGRQLWLWRGGVLTRIKASTPPPDFRCAAEILPHASPITPHRVREWARQCRRRTLHPSGRCHQHRGG